MRLAYADPPYIGRAYYYDHPDTRTWNNPAEHAALMARLAIDYDGWALSCHAPALRILWPVAPARARAAVWVKPWRAGRKNVRVAYTWEAVIYVPARDRTSEGAQPTRDHLNEPTTIGTGVVGAKPESFCRWVLDLMGYVDGDEVTDLFPGSGVMDRVVAQRSLVLTSDDDADEQLAL